MTGDGAHAAAAAAVPDHGDDGEGGDDFLVDVSLAVRAQRRRLRLDQRALALRAGVAKSTVARIERGDGTITLPVLRAVLAVTGLGLALVDEDGYSWRDGDALAADLDDAIDEAGRRLPAHLPASLSDGLVSWDFRGGRRPSLRAPARWRYNRWSDDVAAMVEEIRQTRRDGD